MQRSQVRHVVVIGEQPAGVTGVPASAWHWCTGQGWIGDLSAHGMQLSQTEVRR